MNTLQAELEKYPKVKEAFYKWSGKMLNGLQMQMAGGIPEGVEVTLPRIENEMGIGFGNITLENHPRNLFTFFDGYQIYLIIDYIYDRIRIDTPEWFYKTWEGQSEFYTSRVTAEIDGFKKAFQLLENQLNETNNRN